MLVERTSVGLDVHARSVAAAAIDGVTGEVLQARLTPSHDRIRSWIGDLDGPVAVAGEAGPTGFGLYRALTEAGIRCVVAAPSKLQRPSGDRVKTDAKDAVHLARLLRLGELTAVAVPSVDQDAVGSRLASDTSVWVRPGRFVGPSRGLLQDLSPQTAIADYLRREVARDLVSCAAVEDTLKGLCLEYADTWTKTRHGHGPRTSSSDIGGMFSVSCALSRTAGRIGWLAVGSDPSGRSDGIERGGWLERCGAAARPCRGSRRGA